MFQTSNQCFSICQWLFFWACHGMPHFPTHAQSIKRTSAKSSTEFLSDLVSLKKIERISRNYLFQVTWWPYIVTISYIFRNLVTIYSDNLLISSHYVSLSSGFQISISSPAAGSQLALPGFDQLLPQRAFDPCGATDANRRGGGALLLGSWCFQTLIQFSSSFALHCGSYLVIGICSAVKKSYA